MPSQSTGAADFLGLTEELPQTEVEQAPSNAWLFEMEAEAPIVPAAAAPALAALPSAPSDAEPQASLAAPAAPISRLLLGLAGLVLLGGAVLMLPFGSTSSTPALQTTNSVQPVPAQQPVGELRSEASTAVSAPEPTLHSSEPRAGASSSDETIETALIPQATLPHELPPESLGADTGTALTPATSASADGVEVLVLAVAEQPATPVQPPSLLGPGVRRATAEDYRGLYMGSGIPQAEIHGAGRMNTPQVGLVRADLTNGESYQGTLHSVGMGCVWLDLELGRMRIDARELRALDKLPELNKASALEKAIAGLPPVRVRTPGGAIDGWLVSRTDDKVTLVTASAQRLVLESREVEPLGGTQTRLVRRSQP